MKITPTEYVQLPLQGVANELTITVNAFTIFPANIDVTWRIEGPQVSKEGVIRLPQHIVDQWGTDDTVVKDYVLSQLNLTESENLI